MSKKPIKTEATANPFTKKSVGGGKGYPPKKTETVVPMTATVVFTDGSKRKWKESEKVRAQNMINKLTITL